jgi:hypothetical protein
VLHFLQIPKPPAAAAAAGSSRAGSSKAARSLQANYKAQLERCGLALVLFWARWRRGEPIIVRGCKASCLMLQPTNSLILTKARQ